MRANESMQRLKSSAIREWTQRLKENGAEIQLTLGEPGWATPEPICQAACRSMNAGNTHYPPAAGQANLREALAERQHRRWGWRVRPEQFVITDGAQEALAVTCLGLLNPGDEVLVQDPGYPGYLMAVALAGARPVACPASESFQPVLGEMEKRITPKTRMMILNTPSNPTGRCIEAARLAELGALADRYDLVIVLDLVYEQLAWQPLDLTSLRPYRSRLVLINSFSKPYAMTGWRIGSLCAPVRWSEVLIRTHQALVSGVSAFSQQGALAALETDVSQTLAVLERNSKRMWQAFCQAGLDCPYPQGSFYLFPNVRKTGMDGEQFALKLCEAAKVAVLPGSLFGQRGRWHIRASACAENDQIEQAAIRISQFLSGKPLK